MGLLDERNWYLPRWLTWLPKVQVEEPAGPAPTTDRELPRRPLPVR
jgi:RND superfamily putative drug exporter